MPDPFPLGPAAWPKRQVSPSGARAWVTSRAVQAPRVCRGVPSTEAGAEAPYVRLGVPAHRQTTEAPKAGQTKR